MRRSNKCYKEYDFPFKEKKSSGTSNLIETEMWNVSCKVIDSNAN